ncbi:MAG: hypothetical protein Q8P18_33025 [Pseudomonadota bacterium]|nr:hypothetical protein [Pseudomonadota bacterium]
MMRLPFLLPLLAMSGCAGSVQLEEVDPFGGAASAVWLHWDDSEFDSIVLTNVPGACAKWQAYADTANDLYDAVEDIDEDDYCEDAMEPSLAAARAADALFHEGAHTLSLAVYEGGSTEPEEDTYEVGGTTRALGGTLIYYENSPYAAVLADWDADDDYEDNCGIDQDDLETETDRWTLSEGELDFGQVTDERSASAYLEGDLDDDDGDDAGEIIAKFTASWCEIEL